MAIMAPLKKTTLQQKPLAVAKSVRLSDGSRDEIGKELAKAGAAEGDSETAFAQIEDALARYESAAPKPTRRLQRKNAEKILEATTKLRRLVDGADKETRKRLYLGVGRRHADDKNKRLNVGRGRWNNCFEDLKAGADYAIKRASRKSGKGNKAEDPARLPLVIELLEVWKDQTHDEDLTISKKGDLGKDAGLRRFVNRVLKTGAGLELREKSLLSLMRDARDALRDRSEESEESDNNEDFEC
jgi:hypothetical protein